MKFSTNSSEHNSNTLFYEQVQHITNIYEQWNDCERTVVAYALFKRLPFANLKFLVHSIDHHLKQTALVPKQFGLLEEAANATSFLNKLIHKYNSLVNYSSNVDNIDSSSSDQELSGSESVKSLENDLVSKYNNKEEILQDLLMYLPLLRSNNEEGKKVYMQFLPVLIDDSIKHNMPIELVQQLLSYLLIHPVIKFEDRKPLNQWLQKLQDHLAMSFTNSIGNTLNFLPSDNASSFMSTGSSISSASSSSSASSTTWPTTVPQIQTINNSNNDLFKIKRNDQDFFDIRNFQITQDFCDDLNQTKYPLPIGNNNASQNNLNSSKSTTNASIFDTTDEHHISFSKNGTEVELFENDFLDISKAGNQNTLTVNAPMSASNDYLTVPNFYNDRLYEMYGLSGLSDGFSDDGNNTIKTRRSNSLTTPIASGGDFTSSSSAENLANLQKPRSFSLSMESSRNALMSSGSETRLDKMNFNNNSHHIGMNHIPVWLKSLRLHKYQWLFTNMSYEQMMDITEEYLENLGVTKGARHKLVLCIQKLADRMIVLKQIEKELMDGTRSLKSALDEMMNIVVTPMKPINSVPCDEDVATQLMKTIDSAFQIVQSIKYISNTDEESVNIFLWVLDKALHHEAFIQQIPHLKEYKGKLQRLKMMFTSKGFNSGSNSNLSKGNMKMRWPKTKMNNSNIPDNQKNRKNSLSYFNNMTYQNNGGNMQFSNFGNLTNFQRSASREKLNQFSMMQQQHHMQFNQQNVPSYRHSLNNLMPFNVQQQQQNRRNSSCGTDRITISNASMPSQFGSSEKILNEQGLNKSTSPILMNMSSSATILPPTTSDINSRLESLCRQMTEQAIN
ncbi:hypothetical protein PVAND_007875 [Polypedilum vanderplanki]|uniref:Protein Smaug n=1 Tax=Polypedilum vanderplanki TaxID=319348 RepID=A0A9J6C958_POLVA|nr:hypothetical protein PVAND_007875 [Polypedilum vanderplanki]